MSRLPQLTPKVKRPQEAGQALLIVLLAMSIVLTVVLSAVSRSVTDISVTSYEENSLRAFSAAEAGVEEALLKGTSPGTYPAVTLDTGVTYNLTVSSPAPGNKTDFNYPGELVSGQSAIFWFVSHNATGQLSCVSPLPCYTGAKIDRICWGKSGAVGPQPAIEVTIFYDPTGQAVTAGNFSGIEVVRFAYDPNSGRTFQNNFSQAGSSCGSDGKILQTSYPFETGNIVFPNVVSADCKNTPGCILMAKVRMFYNSTPAPLGLTVSVSGTGSLPAQGSQIESTGVAVESTRKVNVFQAYPEPPSIFDTAVFSLKSIVK